MNIITEAFAEEAVQQTAAAVPSNGMMSLFPFVVIFFIFYFMLIRPQMKKQKEHLAMVDSLKKGTKVVTSGGIIGTITKIEDNIAHVEIAPDIKVKVMKSTITEMIGSDKQEKADHKEEKAA